MPWMQTTLVFCVRVGARLCQCPNLCSAMDAMEIHTIQESVAMEIDRIEGKGDKGKGKGKGKSDKGKGKGKGKKGDRNEKGKGKGKWKGGASYEKGKGGWQQDKGSGKSKGKDSRPCWKCGAEGHFARDCVRQVSEGASQVQQLPQGQQQQSQQAPSGSGISTVSGISSFSSGTLPTRVARITRMECYNEHSTPATFDLRGLASGFSSEESIRVVNEFYIGDEDEIDKGMVRMVAEAESEFEEEDKVAIIIDSGADAPIFPATWKKSGVRVLEKEKRSGL